jgi:hypothetical protein
MGDGEERVRESNRGGLTDPSKINSFRARIHREIPLNTDFGMKNKGQVCKIGPVGVKYM